MSLRTRFPARFATDSAASDVIGSVLLVAITVVAAGGFGIVLSHALTPSSSHHSDLTLALSPGPDGKWGTGDEVATVRHSGGEALAQSSTKFILNNGTGTIVYAGSSLASDSSSVWSDSRFAIGETWTRTVRIASGGQASLLVVGGEGASTVLGTYSTTTDCAGELNPPTITSWTQTPASLSMSTTGSVLVTITAADDCSGLDPASNAKLNWRLGAIGGFAPVTMSFTVPNTWSSSIPATTWANYGGQSLYYTVTGLSDSAGNVLASAVQVKPIGTVTVFTPFASAPAFALGTIDNAAPAKSWTDAGAASTLTEGAAQAVGPILSIGGTATSFTGAPTTPANAKGVPDAAYAKLTGSADTVTVTTFPSGSGPLQKVEVLYTGHVEGALGSSPDQLRLTWTSGAATGSSTFSLTASDSDNAIDVTSALPALSWASVSALSLKADWVKNGAVDTVKMDVDALWVRATTTHTVYALDGTFVWAGVPLGSPASLEIAYSTTGTDSFAIAAWNGASWDALGSVAPSATPTTWSHALTTSEVGTGAPIVRFTDSNPLATVQGTLSIDYARVRSN